MLSLALAGAANAAVTRTDAELDEAQRLIGRWGGDGDGLERAQALLESALKRSPESARVYRVYAEFEVTHAMHTSADYDPDGLARAATLLDRAIALAPGEPAGYIQRCEVLRLQGQLNEANLELSDGQAHGANASVVALGRA